MDKRAKPLPNNTEIVLKLEVAGKDYALAGTIEKRQHLFTAANRTIEHLNKLGRIPSTIIGDNIMTGGDTQ